MYVTAWKHSVPFLKARFKGKVDENQQQLVFQGDTITGL